jgi:hypothetical protein
MMAAVVAAVAAAVAVAVAAVAMQPMIGAITHLLEVV